MNDLKRKLSINTKIIFIVLVGVLILVSSLYFISTNIILKNYLDIEEIETLNNLERADNAIDNDISQLSVKLSDWSSWDDTYVFAENKNETYIKSNLNMASILNLKLNLVAFFDSKGSLIYKSMIDLDSGEEVNGSSIESVVSLDKKLSTHEIVDSKLAGMVMLPEGLFLIASNPILNSEGDGPVNGSIIFGILLNDSKIKEMSDLTKLSLNIYDIDSGSLPVDVLKAKSEMYKLQNGEYFINPISNDRIAGYKMIKDINGKVVSILKIDTPRIIYTKGKNTINSFMIISSVFVLLFGFLLVFLISKYFVRRISILSSEVEEIYKKGNLEIKVKEGAKDEIGILAIIINNVFSSLVTAKKIENEAKNKLEVALVDQKKRSEETEKLNKLMVGRELEMIKLKKEIEELRGK